MVIGYESFGGSETSNRRGKSFGAHQVAFATWPYSEESMAEQRSFLEQHHIFLNPAPYYTQIEVVAAAGPSFRFGFNPGELADFLLGWFGIDIYKDDLGKQKMRDEASAGASAGGQS